jgi:predicted nucleic acid-binding protein
VTDFVLDASIALAWVLDNPAPSYAVYVRREFVSGKRALAPALWHLEIANGLAMAERRGDLGAADVKDALEQIMVIARGGLEIDPSVPAASEMMSKARAWGLTAYDAVYVDLALRAGIPLASLDRSMKAAALKAGASLLK